MGYLGGTQLSRLVGPEPRAVLQDVCPCLQETQGTRPQRGDRGPQYRAAVFYLDDEQKALAESSKSALQSRLPSGKNIVTEVLAASQFYNAEEYHQDYYKKNPLRYKYYRFNCGRDKRLEQVQDLLKANS